MPVDDQGTLNGRGPQESCGGIYGGIDAGAVFGAEVQEILSRQGGAAETIRPLGVLVEIYRTITVQCEGQEAGLGAYGEPISIVKFDLHQLDGLVPVSIAGAPIQGGYYEGRIW